MQSLPVLPSHPFSLPLFTLDLRPRTFFCSILQLLLHLGLDLVHLARKRGVPAAKVPVVQVPVALYELRGEVDCVTAEEQVVCGGDGHGVAHKGAGVEGEGAGHAA